MDFPRTVDEITPEWLTQVLRESGAIGDASVRSRTVKTIGDDQGMTADVVRIGLSYDREEPTAPRSVIAKLHRPWGADDDSILSDTLRITYEREVRFFKELGSYSGKAVPRLHFAEFDESPAEFILLL